MRNSVWIGMVMMALGQSPVLAQDAPSGGGEAAEPSSPTREQRQEMAKVHEQMADCLRSDRSVSECRREMRRQCQEHMAEGGCPMMGGMGMGGGMGQGRGQFG